MAALSNTTQEILMRTLKEVQDDFGNVCGQIGQLEANKRVLLQKYEDTLKPLHDKVAALEAEAGQIRAVDAEVAKKEAEKAAAEAGEAPVDVAPAVEATVVNGAAQAS
jgi:hypothetical protein